MFDIYCINLPEDVERRQHLKKQFESVNIDDSIVNYMCAEKPFSGYKSTNYQFAGELGCTLSHLKAIIRSMENFDQKNLLIVEDDATFHNSLDLKKEINNVINDLHVEWDIIYLGGSPTTKLKNYNDKLCIVTGEFKQTVGYILNAKSKIKLAEFITDSISKPFPNACADNILSNFRKEDRVMCFYPPLIYQKEGYSPLRNGYRDYRNKTDSHWKENRPE